MRRNVNVLLAMALILGSMNAARAGLVSHFTFDGNLEDSVSGNHGTLSAGEATFVSGFDGRAGGALSFSGSQLVNLTYTSGLPLSANMAFSVSMWVKGGLQNDRRVFSEGSSTSNTPLYNIGTDNTGATGAVDIFIRNDANQTLVNHHKTPRSAFNNVWHHIAVVDDNGVITIYIDGIAETQRVTYTRSPLTVNRTSIGGIQRAGAGSFFTGVIDDVRFYDHALTAEEVAAFLAEPEDCPEEGDTTCEGIMVEGPEGNVAGEYTLTAVGAADASGDSIIYTFIASGPEGAVRRVGPQATASAKMLLFEGVWTLTVEVDDIVVCNDPPGVCSTEITVERATPARLVAHLPLHGNVADASGNGNHGTYVGSPNPLFAAGHDCVYPGAARFDGTDDYIRLQQASGLPIFNNVTYSVAMWVKGPPGQVDRRVFSEGSTTSNNPLFNIGTDNTGMTGAVDIFIRTDANATLVPHLKSQAVAFDDTWHHVAWVDRAGFGKLYIDGVLDATTITYTKVPLTVNTTTVGGILRAAPSFFFRGRIEDVRLYNYGLSAEEVEALAGTPVDCPEVEQVAGDCTGDGRLQVTDVICYVRLLFAGFLLTDRTRVVPPCGDNAAGNRAVLDINGDGNLNVADAVGLAIHIFRGGPPPVQGPGCFLIPENLGCEENAACGPVAP
jgi:hypothetical protein